MRVACAAFRAPRVRARERRVSRMLKKRDYVTFRGFLMRISPSAFGTILCGAAIKVGNARVRAPCRRGPSLSASPLGRMLGPECVCDVGAGRVGPGMWGWLFRLFRPGGVTEAATLPWPSRHWFVTDISTATPGGQARPRSRPPVPPLRAVDVHVDAAEINPPGRSPIVPR